MFMSPTYAQSQPLPKVQAGTLERLESFPSRFVEARHIDVWLPPDYSQAKRYRVLYMQDGQMLYDPDVTWNKQAWRVDMTMSRLLREGRVSDTIVVGVWNTGKHRYAEYFPEKALALATEPVRRDYVERAQLGRSRADDYLRFLVEELKPEIDRRYSTHTGPAHTAVMGSSMGGLISLYALTEYPGIFGAAACLSTHWVGRPTAWGRPPQLRNAELPLALFNHLRGRLPPAATHRLYMDRGTAGLDGAYDIYQSLFDQIVAEKGYTSANWQSVVIEGADHDEKSWAARLEAPLQFLLGSR